VRLMALMAFRQCHFPVSRSGGKCQVRIIRISFENPEKCKRLGWWAGGWLRSKVCDLSESASRFTAKLQASNLKVVNLINECGHGMLGNMPNIPSIW